MRSNHWRTLNFSLLIALILLNASTALAQTATVTDFKAVARTGNTATYLDLLRKVFPDAEMKSRDGKGAIAHKSIPLSQLFGDYKDTVYQEEMRINSIETPGEQNRNNGRLLLLIHVGSDSGGLSSWNELNVLALFELAPGVKLLDAVDVQADKFSEFWIDGPMIQTGLQTDAVIISNSHHNSSQEYQSLTIVGPVNDRLKILFDLPVLLGSRDCGKSITQTPYITSTRGTSGVYFNISVVVKLVKDPDDPGCEKRTKGYTRNYKALFVWNASKHKYQSRGVALNQLGRFNKQRF